MSAKDLQPRNVAALFVMTTLVHLLALASRFNELATFVPQGIAQVVLLAHFPLLLVEGYFEARVDYGTAERRVPLWMQISSRPIKWSFTLAFTYLSVVLIQTWDVSLGPIDPSPPPQWPLAQRAMWFGVMSLVMFFPNYLATSSLVIPLLRLITRPLGQLRTLLALVLLMIIGAGLGYGVVTLLEADQPAEGIESIQTLIWDTPWTAIGVTLGMVWIPILWGWLRQKRSE